MPVPTAYLTSTKNVAPIFDAIQRAGVPERFTFEFLKQLGFASSSDRAIIPVLKAIGFLTDASGPTERYRRFKDPSIAKAILAQGIREGYADVFAIDTQAYQKSSQDLTGMFGRLSDKGEAVNQKMATTFKALSSLANFSAGAATTEPKVSKPEDDLPTLSSGDNDNHTVDEDRRTGVLTLRHDIHLHLPLSTDVAVYDAIFRSVKANLL
ncbi:MAG: DUF5343 domain-containing protein [Jatrophihabitans sp.]|uniref:DUF5343 domain-containing protein n=1 Tax=Jatrophihabitans sp. TaxID=1932789 RepID=UPI003F81142D